MLSFANPISEKFSFNRYLKAKTRADRELTLSMPSERFVIFNFPRSGSNLLCSMLNQHPEILCHHEIFNPKKVYYAKNFHELLGGSEVLDRSALISGKIGISSKIKRDFNPEKFCFELWRHHYNYKAVGFNLFPSHVPNTAAVIAGDHSVKKILLLRKNKLKCYVSRMIARQTGVWDLYARKNRLEHKKTPQISLRVNPRDLVRWSKKYDSYFREMQRVLTEKDQPFIQINYEDLVGKEGVQVKSKILSFINVLVEPEYLESPLKKQNPNCVFDLISNFSEVKEALVGTEFETLLLDQ